MKDRKSPEKYCHIYLALIGTGDVIECPDDLENRQVLCYKLEGECPYNNQGKMVQLGGSGRYYMKCLSSGLVRTPVNIEYGFTKEIDYSQVPAEERANL